MGLILKISQVYLPAFIKMPKLKELFARTADAFNSKAPDMDSLSFDECLEQFALFTNKEAEKAIQRGDNLEQIKERLYQNAYELGQKLGQMFRVNTMQDIMDAGRIIYRVLNIDFHGTMDGQVTINRCFFSNFYSGQVCRVISSLDEGILAGLSGGGELMFCQRITEGRDCCKASFVMKGDCP